MPLPATFVATMQPMHPREVFEALLNGPKDLRSTLDIVNEVRPADLFCYLWARFGRPKPNGVQNILRSNDSDNLIHWDWTQRHEVRGMLERWTEFVNPYQRIRRSVERLVGELEGLNLRPETDRFDPVLSDAPGGDLTERWAALATKIQSGI